MTRRLVALDLPGGPGFVDALRRVWDDGDAAAPIDQRLPTPARADLLARLAPDVVIGPDLAEVGLDGGRPVEAGDALVVATSGSSGEPRGVVLTHEAVIASARATTARLGVVDGDRWLACLPLSHVGGLSVVTRALITGTDLVVHPRFDPEAVQRSGATLVSLVATALARIDPSRFRIILLGGGPAPVDRPANTVTTYGMTETGSGVVYDGRPLEGVGVRIAADGEILLTGPMLARAYRTATTDLSLDLRDGWLATGDIGHLDDDGRVTVAGRRREMIITGGENVWPHVVEAVLATHPAIADVAVGATDDPEWGQAVTAHVVVAPDRPAPSLEELRDHVRSQLPAYAAPRRLVIVTEIPRTALGKIARSRLGR